MQCFAQAEAAATETLLVLHRVEGRGKEVRLRHLVGQRLADLAAAIEPDGPFGTDGETAFLALEEFKKHEGLRNLLGHGVAKVTLERSGKWIVIVRHLSIKAYVEGRDIRVFDQAEAATVLSDLRKRSNKVCSTLGSVRRLFAAQAISQGDR
tara:strand:- start:7077 stop:7532 length:456 start_codon:yes stop_codon:yes gene_type:complete